MRLSGEPLAAFGAPARENLPSTSCRHACTKPMSSFAMQVAGLIRALHNLRFLAACGIYTPQKSQQNNGMVGQKKGGKGTHGV